MLREKSGIEIPVMNYATSRGWLQRKVGYIGRSGAPDRWFFKEPGRLIIVEFKAPGKKPSPIQDREIERLRSRGFSVHVIDNVEAGCALFD